MCYESSNEFFFQKMKLSLIKIRELFLLSNYGVYYGRV